MTCGCIDFVAKPMYEAMAVLLPHMHDEVFANVTLNRSLWNAFSTNGRRASEASLLPYFVLVFSKPNLISKDRTCKVLGTLFYSSVSLSFFVFWFFSFSFCLHDLFRHCLLFCVLLSDSASWLSLLLL